MNDNNSVVINLSNSRKFLLYVVKRELKNRLHYSYLEQCRLSDLLVPLYNKLSDSSNVKRKGYYRLGLKDCFGLLSAVSSFGVCNPDNFIHLSLNQLKSISVNRQKQMAINNRKHLVITYQVTSVIVHLWHLLKELGIKKQAPRDIFNRLNLVIAKLNDFNRYAKNILNI